MTLKDHVASVFRDTLSDRERPAAQVEDFEFYFMMGAFAAVVELKDPARRDGLIEEIQAYKRDVLKVE